jgi:hypothetical protein
MNQTSEPENRNPSPSTTECQEPAPELPPADAQQSNGTAPVATPDPEAAGQVLSPQPGTAELDEYLQDLLAAPPVTPWPERVDGCQLLEEIMSTMTRFVVLPKWAPVTLTLFVPHTYAHVYRDITTYIGIESPTHRCGKSTLITILSELTHRAVVASNVSAPSFFRVIARVQPTLLIDEADTFLAGNEELKGIINSSYFRKTAYVLRAINLPAQGGGNAPGNGRGQAGNGSGQAGCLSYGGVQGGATAPGSGPRQAGDRGGQARCLSYGGQSSNGAGYNPDIVRFSCWCPKVISRIGPLPITLADRCIVFRMQRKTAEERCERLRKFSAGDLKRKCLRFVLDNAAAIAAAEPALPPELNDRAADIWEPLFVIADLAGGPWPARAREAAVAIATASTDSNPLGLLLFDIVMEFVTAETERMFSADLVQRLALFPGRPWGSLLRGKPINERWLAKQLNPYGIRPRNLRIGKVQAKGYLKDELVDICCRYVPKPELRAFLDELKPAPQELAAGGERESGPKA